MNDAVMELYRLWDSIIPGETVLAEYDSLVLPYKGFYYLVNWAREKGYHLIIIDILDTLYLYKTQIELTGLDTDVLDRSNVIKIGGRLNVGNVLARLPATDIQKLLQEFEHEYATYLSKIENENSVIIMLGFSKLLLLAESKFEGLMIIDLLIRYSGTRKRTAFYFLNLNVLKEDAHGLIGMLEELATTVMKTIRAKMGEDIKPYVYVTVPKAVNPELEGSKLRI